MLEFVNFVLRHNNARTRRRGSIIDIIVSNKPIATYYVNSSNRIHLHFDAANPIADKMKELIRFKVAMTSSKPVVINNSQCTEQKCFRNLIDDFRDEWHVFMNHNNTSTTFELHASKKQGETLNIISGEKQREILKTTSVQAHESDEKCDKLNAELFLDVLKRFSNQLDLISAHDGTEE